MAFIAVYDADVLYPNTLRDRLIRIGQLPHPRRRSGPGLGVCARSVGAARVARQSGCNSGVFVRLTWTVMAERTTRR